MDARILNVAHGREPEIVDTWLQSWTEQCWKRMVQVAMWAKLGPDSAEEVAQHALLVALTKARHDPDLIATVECPCAWLIGITKNVIRDRRRRELRRARIRRENVESICQVLFPQPDPDWDVDRLCERVLDVAETVLKGRRLEVVRCTIVSGMTDREIAEALGISRRAVRVHRRNTLQTIRKHMWGGG